MDSKYRTSPSSNSNGLMVSSVVGKTTMSATSSFQSTNNSTTQSKRLVFKNLKASPKLPENFESVTWKRLQAAVRAIHLNLGTSDSLEELYKAVEDLCSHKMGANLYRNLQSECAEHIQLVIQKRLLESQSSSAFIYLGLLYNQWNEHCSHMRLIHSIFLFLDRTFVIQNVEVRPIWEMGLELFRNNIIEHPDIRRKTISDLLKLIEQERNGETVDKMLLKNLIHMLVSLQVYSKFFENLFLETTQTFYRNKSQLLMKELELSEYLKHTENCLQEENERVLQYLASSTKAALIATVEKQLLEVHIDGLLSKGFRSLMEESKSDDLRRLYLLFARVNGATEILRKAFGLFVKTRGSILVSDVQREPTLVQDLLDFKAKMDFLLENSFFKLTTFLNALREAFESFINLRSGKVAELLAKFVGSKMSCANKSSSEEDLEQLLDRVMILFRFVHGKDTFEAFYKNDLSKRLLLGRYNVDLEKSMISRLKTECGSSFSHKLEGMFKDFELSKDIMISFKESNYYREKLSDIDLNVHVLTNGYWPAFSSVEINLPKQLSNYLEIFKAFYLQKYSGRKLMWRNTLDHCLVKYQTQSLKKELHISLFQTTVLLLFNEHDRISFKDMEQITGIETEELKSVLQSLSSGTTRILLKEPKNSEINESDIFKLNTIFQHKLYRIKINYNQMKETIEENQKTNQAIMQDRQYQIDAAIVRIMKTRKSLLHQQLVSELFKQLTFPVKPIDLKKRIESLIDREYLERDPENSQLFRYLA